MMPVSSAKRTRRRLWAARTCSGDGSEADGASVETVDRTADRLS
jgi:hypothetical protein